jgi:hypothetical protein
MLNFPSALRLVKKFFLNRVVALEEEKNLKPLSIYLLDYFLNACGPNSYTILVILSLLYELNFTNKLL